MPHVLDTRTRTEELMHASWRLIDEGGTAAVTLRRLGDEVGIAPSSIVHQLTNRERLIRVLAVMTNDEHLARTQVRSLAEGWAGFLPRDEEDLLVLRAWLAWSELGRADRELGDVLDVRHARERSVVTGRLQRQLDHEPTDALVESVLALVRGLQLAVTLRPGGLDPELARTALVEGVPQLTAAAAASRSEETMASGSSAE
ncbi:TetR family transcriptional regulator [Nocardioides sp. IC4_145]|uniref:TetR family transcriptional regulator C-terminal domain-containing protein n=1 Tax=Nocardioides sp. IC4_145 TaxID=2714037 RepID=UPI00140D3C5F|nr:TetR family transcriptional regulator C-terminal domain-containing protein [Nocardioides sp. IC4_145]NHC22038.1 TetR family transcriptional regulator [Nocardioides sp. IC4_145]